MIVLISGVSNTGKTVFDQKLLEIPANCTADILINRTRQTLAAGIYDIR